MSCRIKILFVVSFQRLTKAINIIAYLQLLEYLYTFLGCFAQLMNNLICSHLYRRYFWILYSILNEKSGINSLILLRIGLTSVFDENSWLHSWRNSFANVLSCLGTLAVAMQWDMTVILNTSFKSHGTLL